MHDIGKEAIATQCCFAWLSVGLPLTVASGAFQPLAPPEKTASSQVSLCHVLRPSPNSVSGQLRTAFVTIAGCLFASRLEHLIFNKSHKNWSAIYEEVWWQWFVIITSIPSPDGSPDETDKKKKLDPLCGWWQVQTWPLQWDLIRYTAHHRLRSFPQAHVCYSNPENCQVNNWPLIRSL